MKAIVIEETGGRPAALQTCPIQTCPGTVPVPCSCRGREFSRPPRPAGNYAQAPELPTIPGVEVAGETEDGRRVMALLTGGGYAERVAVDEERLFPLPEGASFAEGASFLLTFLTAWIPLTRQVRLEPDRPCSSTPARAVWAPRRSSARGTSARASSPRRRPRRSGTSASSRAPTTRSATTSSRRPCARTWSWTRSAVSSSRPASASSHPRHARLHRLRGRLVAGDEPCAARGRNVGIQGFYLGRLMARRPDVVVAAAGELLEAWSSARSSPWVGGEFPWPRPPTPTG